MAFNATLEMLEGRVAQITLSGDLDASSAASFRESVEKAAAESPVRLVLRMRDLSYMASAGLRVLIFAKQKMGAKTEVHVVGAQPAVLNTIAMTGFDRSVVLVDEQGTA